MKEYFVAFINHLGQQCNCVVETKELINTASKFSKMQTELSLKLGYDITITNFILLQ